MVPRASASPAFDRTGGSTASQPGGSRKRRSRPLALTDLISHAHAYPPDIPWPRANPVMLDSAMAENFRFAGNRNRHELNGDGGAPQADAAARGESAVRRVGNGTFAVAHPVELRGMTARARPHRGRGYASGICVPAMQPCPPYTRVAAGAAG